MPQLVPVASGELLSGRIREGGEALAGCRGCGGGISSSKVSMLEQLDGNWETRRDRACSLLKPEAPRTSLSDRKGGTGYMTWHVHKVGKDLKGTVRDGRTGAATTTGGVHIPPWGTVLIPEDGGVGDGVVTSPGHRLGRVQ